MSGVLSLGVKWLVRELTVHLHLVPRLLNAWSCVSTLPMAWYLVKHGENSVFTFTDLKTKQNKVVLRILQHMFA